MPTGKVSSGRNPSSGVAPMSLERSAKKTLHLINFVDEVDEFGQYTGAVYPLLDNKERKKGELIEFTTEMVTIAALEGTLNAVVAVPKKKVVKK